MRLMKFDLSGEQASVRVSTISTYYKTTASKLPTYSAFYKEKEKPTATDEEFVASDEFTIDLDDFYSRFASARVKGKGKRKCWPLFPLEARQRTAFAKPRSSYGANGAARRPETVAEPRSIGRAYGRDRGCPSV